MSGLVSFTLGERDYATPLTDVREVVRLIGLADVPGMQPPVAGVLDLRGSALPVLDLRAGTPGAASPGDVLVLEREIEAGGALTTVGVAVDRVLAVVDDDSLAVASGSSERGLLPGYVREVLRGANGPVFLVDLEEMIEAVRGVLAAGLPAQADAAERALAGAEA